MSVRLAGASNPGGVPADQQIMAVPGRLAARFTCVLVFLSSRKMRRGPTFHRRPIGRRQCMCSTCDSYFHCNFLMQATDRNDKLGLKLLV